MRLACLRRPELRRQWATIFLRGIERRRHVADYVSRHVHCGVSICFSDIWWPIYGNGEARSCALPCYRRLDCGLAQPLGSDCGNVVNGIRIVQHDMGRCGHRKGPSCVERPLHGSAESPREAGRRLCSYSGQDSRIVRRSAHLPRDSGASHATVVSLMLISMSRIVLQPGGWHG